MRLGGFLLFLLLVLSACGGGDDGDAAPAPSGAGTTTSAAPTTSASTTAGTPASSGTTSTGAAATTSAAPSAPSTPVKGETSPAAVKTRTVAGLTDFSSPSKNVSCYIQTSSVRCDILDRTWKPPAKPADCDVDYGQGISLAIGKAQFVCAGDTAMGSTDVLPYGQAVKSGTVVCTSLTTGMECKDTSTAHGFALARGAYRIF